MSFQLNQEKGKKSEIEMPPVQPETQEAAPEAVSAEQPESTQEVAENLQQDTQVSESKPAEESAQAKNFRQLREKAEKLERERDEAIKYIQSLQKPQQVQPEETEDIGINDNDLVEGKHLAKITKKYKKLEAELKQYQQQQTADSIETKLKVQYPDFDKVVSRDNVEMLKAAYPELAQTLNTSSDLYNKAVSAYTMIKKLGIAKEDDSQSEKAIALKNAAKPKPLASISPQQGDTPLSRANAFANGLTDELKAQLRKEMETARRNM
jgi:hypothetical protein